MKLISCYVENFGAINKREFEFSDGLTCVVNDNGAGKTTLAAFIRAMFYGLPAVRSNSKRFDDRQRYYPFSGGKFGGNLTFGTGGKVYRIERFFDKKSDARDETRVYCGGKPTDALGENIGETLFGLDAESFSRTVFFDGGEPVSGAGADVVKKLNGDISAQDGGDLEGALDALDGRRKQLKAARGTGGYLDRKKAERLQLREEIENYENISRGLAPKYGERAELEKRIGELERANCAAVERRIMSERHAALRGYESELLKTERAIEDFDAQYPAGLPDESELDGARDCFYERNKYAALNENTPQYGANKSNLWLLIAGAVLAVAGAGICFLHLAGLAVIALGIICAGVYFIISREKNRKGRLEQGRFDDKIRELDGKIDGLFAKYNLRKPQDIAGAIAVIRGETRKRDGLLRERERLLSRIDEYKRANAIDGESVPAAETESDGRVQAELFAARRRLGLLDGEIADDENAVEILPVKKNALEKVESEIAELTEAVALLAKTAEHLRRADGSLKEKFVSPVRERFLHYADKIYSALGEKMVMTPDFTVKFEREGQLTDERHLSAGQRCVCALCLRLALIDNTFIKEKPFLIMDDPFLGLDAENMDGVKRVVRELAKCGQIVYFTCHNSRKI